MARRGPAKYRRKAPTKTKKPKKSTTNRKALITWSLKVRERDGHRCQVCGRKEYIQSHHLLPKKQFPQFKLEIINGIAVCARCHTFSQFSMHSNPFWSAEWVRVNRPEVYKWIMDRLAELEGSATPAKDDKDK